MNVRFAADLFLRQITTSHNATAIKITEERLQDTNSTKHASHKMHTHQVAAIPLAAHLALNAFMRSKAERPVEGLKITARFSRQ